MASGENRLGVPAVKMVCTIRPYTAAGPARSRSSASMYSCSGIVARLVR
jgi:hypothetical protein